MRNSTRYYPYGEEQTATANNTEKFATYYRDSATGLDYAQNRYYSSTLGRFTTPDPSWAILPEDPKSWNRYTYVGGDPANNTDQNGLVWQLVDCQSAGYLDAESEISGIPWQTCTFRWINITPGASNLFPGRGGGGGGGGRQSFITVTNLSKSGPNQDLIFKTMNDIYANIDSQCAQFLGGIENVRNELSGIFENNLIAHGRIVSQYAAVTSGRNSNIPSGYAVDVINDNGPFFRSSLIDSRGNVATLSVNQGKIPGNTDKARVFILLHELGHLLKAPDFQDDLDNKDAGKANDKLVETNCKDTLKLFK